MTRTTRKVLLALLLCGTSLPAAAGGSAMASAEALTHSLQALGYSIEGVFKLASGAAAIPLMSVGAIGEASGEAGAALWEEANAPPSGPLPVTDEVVTAGPSPAEQLEQ